MSENCLPQNPLVRDGTSQRQRLLKALLPSYVPVDERSMKDLVNFARKIAGEINYFESDEATPDGQWDDFFEFTDQDWADFSLDAFIQKLKETQQTAPHLALFLGFLYMFKTAQDDLNTLTRRHLNFYYRDVLQLEEKPAVPDQVAIIFTLAKHVDQHRIEEGTVLKAGKDAQGIERIYELERDLVVNKATISSLKAVFANVHIPDVTFPDSKEVSHRIFESHVANSADGQGADIETEEQSWRPFGAPEKVYTNNSETEFVWDREQAEVGFAIASPMLFLAEGTRIITLNITLNRTISDDGVKPKDFKILLSGEKEWIPIEVLTETKIDSDILTLKCKLPVSSPPVVVYNPEELEEPFDTEWPVLKVLLNTEEDRSPATYHLFKGLRATKINITVNVEGVKNLVLQNDHSVLDASKPFLPFGNRPYVGSNFYIGSWEVFQKKLTSLNLNFQWNDLPQIEDGSSTGKGFKAYYDNYNDGDRTNEDFTIDIDILDDKEWQDLFNNSVFLLTGKNGDKIGDEQQLPGSDAQSKLKIKGDYKLIHIDRDPDLKALTEYNVNTQKGFLRITMKNQDFGHGSFQNSYAQQAIKLANYEEEPNTERPELPNSPYTPKMSDLSLHYESTQDFEIESSENTVEQFFHIEPFGVRLIDTAQTNTFLIPQFKYQGNLYIGIDELQPPQSLSVLFQVAEGSAAPLSTHTGIHWSYLSGDEWDPFDEKSILFDTTNGLLKSGIIQFAIPKNAEVAKSRLPPGKHWIRAAVTHNPEAACRLIDVKTQAVMARFEDQGNDPGHLKNPLEAETISKLLRSDSAINSVVQPYASFGGKMAEQQSDFYTRTSERLRHKQRAITIWDYEHIILEEFPSVYKVKCVNHTRFNGDLSEYSEIAPGHVSCIVVSNVQNQNAVDSLRPMTSLNTLDEISVYLQTIISESVKLHVENPLYEEIKVDFSVKFHSADTGFYKQKLEQDIKEFLAPWSSDCGADITFTGRIHKSMILNFVEERSYVDYVTCFKMYHIIPDDPENNPIKDVDEAEPATAVSILGSADEHTINVIEFTSDECSCEDNEIKSTQALASADECLCQDEITSLPDNFIPGD